MKHSCRGRAVCKCLDGEKVGGRALVINLQIQAKRKITDVTYGMYSNFYKNSRIKYQDKDKDGHNLDDKSVQLQENLFPLSHRLSPSSPPLLQNWFLMSADCVRSIVWLQPVFTANYRIVFLVQSQQ